MVPFLIFLGFSLFSRLLGWVAVDSLDSWAISARVGLSFLLVLTASAHWGKRRSLMLRMVPSRLPRKDLLVTMTGVLELAAVVGMWVPPLRVPAAVGLVLLFLCLFPANVYAARTLPGEVTPLWQRTPQQLLYIAAAVLVAIS